MPGVWGPQVSDYEIRCPYCGSERCRIVWCWTSLYRMTVQVVIGWFLYCFRWRAFSGTADDEYLFPWKLLRRCRDCEASFDPTADPPESPECGRCGYAFSGTTSENCLECGWQIPGPVRAKRAREQREQEGRFW